MGKNARRRRSTKSVQRQQRQEKPRGPFADALSRLEQSEHFHLKFAKGLTESGDRAIFPSDLLCVASLNRSMALHSGFRALMAKRNFTAGAPLVRLELDTALRLWAAGLVDDPHSLAVSILEGKKLSNLTDRDNNKMKDWYLVKSLTAKYPWVQDVYDETSGYVHLSDKHYFNSVQGPPDEDSRTLRFVVSPRGAQLPDSAYVEAADAFLASAKLVFSLIGSWIYAKEHPQRSEPS